MNEGTKRRLVDRVIEPSYIEGIKEASIDDIRAKREESHEGEKELSFERRLCQARIDILTAELDQRSGKTQGDLIDRLPAILAAEGSSSGDEGLPSRAPDFSIPRNADVPRRRVEEVEGEQALARLSTLSDEEIKSPDRVAQRPRASGFGQAVEGSAGRRHAASRDRAALRRGRSRPRGGPRVDDLLGGHDHFLNVL